MLQFHGGGWVSGSTESAANDFFCRRIAKVLRLRMVSRCCIGLGNRLIWLIVVCLWVINGVELKKLNVQCHSVYAFGASMVEPWLAAHADPSRCQVTLLLILLLMLLPGQHLITYQIVPS